VSGRVCVVVVAEVVVLCEVGGRETNEMSIDVYEASAQIESAQQQSSRKSCARSCRAVVRCTEKESEPQEQPHANSSTRACGMHTCDGE
jgi:hypothetical protein